MIRNWQNFALKQAEMWLGKVHTPPLLRELGWRTVWFVARCGRGNPIKFALRLTTAHPYLRTGVGVVIASLAVWSSLTGIDGWSAWPADTGGAVAIALADEGEPNLTTQEAVQIPLSNYRISQKYWWLHAGLDMAAQTGEPVRPIMAGVVKKTETVKGGYGYHVVVEHTQEYQSLYAHLSRISVEEGEKVSTNTVLGEVGSTGRSTGPHLHLEITESGKTINPAAFLGI